MMPQISYDNLVSKWSPVLEEQSAGGIKDYHRKSVTAVMLENQQKALQEERQNASFLSEDAPAGANTGSIGRWDPVLISLVRRSMPNLMAYDVCGVQPMTGPTGLIFAMKSRYGAGSTGSTEALFNEANTAYSGTQATGTHVANNASGLAGVTDADGDSSIGDSDRVTDIFAGGMTTDSAEALGDSLGNPFPEMGFTIEKQVVEAKTRALKAEYTMELAQDLKAIHGLDAETELANILSTEILAEINREVIRTINSQAKIGADKAYHNNTTTGIFDLDTDADGRWSVEKFKGLLLQLDMEANRIAKETRRGRGNFIICSSDVASALRAAKLLDYTPELVAQLQVDDTGNTFAGVLYGGMKVYIDPYATANYVTVGYKGANPYDAGVFYTPYVPLTMVRAVGEKDFQPKIGFKTRYGMASNPFVGSTPTSNGLAAVRTNQYYRIFRVDNIL